jgi:hypothetical protein
MCDHALFWEEKGNTPKDSWRNGFMLKDYALCVICMRQEQNKGMS